MKSFVFANLVRQHLNCKLPWITFLFKTIWDSNWFTWLGSVRLPYFFPKLKKNLKGTMHLDHWGLFRCIRGWSMLIVQNRRYCRLSLVIGVYFRSTNCMIKFFRYSIYWSMDIITIFLNYLHFLSSVLSSLNGVD